MCTRTVVAKYDKFNPLSFRMTSETDFCKLSTVYYMYSMGIYMPCQPPPPINKHKNKESKLNIDNDAMVTNLEIPKYSSFNQIHFSPYNTDRGRALKMPLHLQCVDCSVCRVISLLLLSQLATQKEEESGT